jgi:hypothetical protein
MGKSDVGNHGMKTGSSYLISTRQHAGATRKIPWKLGGCYRFHCCSSSPHRDRPGWAQDHDRLGV